MRFLKPPFVAALLFVFVIGCRKNDFYNELKAETPVAAAKQSGSEWHSSLNWEVAKQDGFSVFHVNINDAAITAEVVNKGLILVYKKDGSAIASLPVEEKTKSASSYWYHQVSEGKILISVDAYGISNAPDVAKAFKYFVITPAKLEELQAKGHTVSSLMNLSFENATTVL